MYLFTVLVKFLYLNIIACQFITNWSILYLYHAITAWKNIFQLKISNELSKPQDSDRSNSGLSLQSSWPICIHPGPYIVWNSRPYQFQRLLQLTWIRLACTHWSIRSKPGWIALNCIAHHKYRWVSWRPYKLLWSHAHEKDLRPINPISI